MAYVSIFDHGFPEWDGIEPLDIYKWRRRREIERLSVASLPMMSAVGADGQPLYRMTSGGCWSRTKPLTRGRRNAAIARDGACVLCGSPAPFEVDHIVRYVDGGSNDLDNLRTLCVPCHRKRGGQA